MLSEADFYSYQHRGVDHIIGHPNCMVWADMGLGKTIMLLTAFLRLRAAWAVSALLIIAPKRIIQSVWRQEAKKWEHTKHLRFSLIHGNRVSRVAALRRRADIYLVNPENLQWLVTEINHRWLRRKLYPPFSMVAYDEITRLKNARMPNVAGGSVNAKAWVSVAKYFSRRAGLTGEPATNGYADLFGQYLVVDGGQRLGTAVTQYRERFLAPSGYQGRSWIATRTGRQQIQDRIADITLSLSAKDYLDLPPVVDNVIWVDLPPSARKIYDQVEELFFAELDSGSTLEVDFAAAKFNKLIQIASGAVYLTTGGPWEEIHREKLEALQDLLEESGGRPVLCGYTYRHEAQRIAAAFPEKPQEHSGATFLSSKLGERALDDVIRRWDADEIPLLCGHPKSMGHGLNLQGSSARAVVWFSLPYDLQLYNQMNARLFGGHRRKGASVVHHILARNTIDEVLLWEKLHPKQKTQQDLKDRIKAYRESK